MDDSQRSQSQSQSHSKSESSASGHSQHFQQLQDRAQDKVEQYGALILSGADESNELSIFGYKFLSQFICFISSLVVFGATSNYVDTGLPNPDLCSSNCGWLIAEGLIAWIILLFVIILNVLSLFNKISRNDWFTYRFEKIVMALMFIWWVPGIAIVSLNEDIPATTWVGAVHAWTAFFSAVYASFKSWHMERENEARLIKIGEAMAKHQEEYERMDKEGLLNTANIAYDHMV